MDETLVPHFDPETKLQSKAWKHPTSPPAVRFHKIASAGKVMACVFGTVKMAQDRAILTVAVAE